MRLDRLAWLTQGFIVSCLIAASSVHAQIVPDGTLGNERSRVTPINPNTERIDGGAIRGSNLFHSFQEFSIGEGRGAYFANPTGVDNILSRVTGRNPSNIFGTLGVLGNANLYLLNPNGIFFGPNARLDIRGSFTASTADSIVFSDRSLYSAMDTQTRPLLTVAVPVGLQYGAQEAGAIANAGNLAVGQGQKLTLLGGTVTSTGQLIAPGGTVQVLGNQVALLDNARIDVSSATGGGTVLVGGDFQGKGEVPNAARTFVAPGVTINADGLTNGNGGRVIIWADDTTRFYGNISARGGTDSGNGGFVEVSGKQNLIFRGKVNTDAFNGATGTLLFDPENITISATGSDDGQIICNGQSCRVAGDGSYTISTMALEALSANTEVTLEATNNITIDQLGNFDAAGSYTPGSLNFQAYTPDPQLLPGAIEFRAGGIISMNPLDTISASGRAVKITGNSVVLGRIVTESRNATSGDITIEAAAGNVKIGAIDSIAQSPLGGGINGANVRVKALFGDVSITDIEAKSITIDTFGKLSVARRLGARSDILVSADSITIGENRKPSSIEVGVGIGTRNLVAGGEGGSIFIETTGLLAVNGAFERNLGTPINPSEPVGSNFSIGSEAFSSGGSIRIAADGGIKTRGGIVSNSRFLGNGGDITLKSSNGAITIPGVIDASSHTAFFGNGGNINIEAGGDITTGTVESIGQRGGQITLNSGGNLSITENDVVSITTGQGRGGDIGLTARSITLTDTRVANLTFGDGRAGDIAVKASESVNILNQGSSSPAEIGSFPLRILKQQASDLNFEGSGIVSTTGSAPGRTATGDTGNITVETKRLLIQAAPGLTESRLAGISTATLQSSSGDSGSITVNASESIKILGNYFKPFIPGVFDAKTARETAAQVRDIRTGITSATQGTGNAGAITIQTGQLSLRQGAAITSGITDEGTGNGGNLTINATSVDLEGKAALATGTLGTSGKAGDLTVNADRITLKDGALISADKVGTGLAGSVTINAGELLLTNRSRIGSSALGSGRGGDLTLTIARSIQMKNIGDPQNATEIASNAFDDANGGNITILVGGQIRAKKGENNDIVATTERGQGGLVDVQAGGLIDFFIQPKGSRTFENELSANSSGGRNGVVNRNGDATQQPPPSQPVVRDLPQVCPQGVNTRQAGRSDFMNTGRGGLPPNPGEALESNTAQVPWVTLEPEPNTSASTTNAQSSTASTSESIEEAHGWARLPNGRVFLTTAASTALPNPCPLRSSQP